MADFTDQFAMLPPAARKAIMADIAGGDNPMPTINMQVAGTPVAGAVFKADADRYQGVTGPLTTTDIAAPAAVAQPGALSRVPVQRQEPDIAAMLEKYMPQDDSQSKYLALAAGFGSATKTGSFSEQLGNVASAMNEQKMSQAKLRSQYVPLIMQQVAAQQAREEQNAYRLEAQQQAQAAQAAAQQREQQFKAEQNAQAQQEARTRAEAERTLREQLATNANDLKRELSPNKDQSTKPLPPSALKMQQDALDAIGISSSINADLGAVEQQIKDGKLKFGPMSNLINKGMNSIGASTEESRNFGSFTSTLERLRNESLRLNTGVQTDGDAQRAWNELFQNINDTDLVKQRLAEIKNINKRGAELQQLKIDGVRANYGHGPLDTSAQRSVPPALNAGPALPSADAVNAEIARRAAAKKGS